MEQYFTTSFGRKIKIREGYRKLLPPILDVDIYNPNNIPPKETTYGIYSDIYRFFSFFNWLKYIGLSNKPFKKMLDVAGNTGLIARLFFATNMAEHVECLDVVDSSSALDLGEVNDLLDTMEKGRLQVVTNKEILPGSEAETVAYYIKVYNSLYPCNAIDLWNIVPHLKRDLILHKYRQEDFYQLKPNSLYDCITTFSAFDHFTPHHFFSKANSLLEPGGFLYMHFANWYWVLNSPTVFPDFPYGCQRLTRNDLKRYFEEFYPEETKKALKAYDYYHNGNPGFVLNDYMETASQEGFLIVNTFRQIPNGGIIPEQQANWRFKGDHGFETLKTVLRDIHCFKSDVTMIDLLTQSYYLVFRKV